MNSSHSRFSPGNLIHKFRSFSNHLRKDPGGAVRRLRGYFRPPLFLFQMGKVGSSTHKNTLQTLYHVHHLHTAADFKIKHRPEKDGDSVDLITIVREPIGRKVSTFFQNLVGSPYGYSFPNREAALAAGTGELLRRFHEWEDGVTEATRWFENHFEPATGIRIYQHEFDPETGWTILSEGKWRVLVLRFEDIRTNHLEALNE
ncbi:MAG: hypothetical protein KDN05_14930 [Verrucomicrobiae bacterium]|nr:hypothetical protein [Verrucomicrobiae bacterium]